MKETIGIILVIIGIFGISISIAIGDSVFGWAGAALVVSLMSIFIGMELINYFI